MPRFVPLVLVALALSPAGDAHARGDPRLEVQLALGVSGSTELRTVVMTSPLLTVSAPVTAETGIVAQWGFTVATGEPTDPAFDSTWFAVGNPLFGWSILVSEGFVFTPSLTLPVARRPGSESARPASEFAFKGGLGLRGEVDKWLWVPDSLSVVLPFAYATFIDPILIEAQVKIGFVGATSDDHADTGFVFQWKARVAAHLGGGFWLATGITGVHEAGEDEGHFQAALSPELRYVIGPGSNLELSVLLNLDSPYGPSSEPGRFWGVHIAGSAPL